MEFYHGVRTGEISTSVSTPVIAASGIPFVVGTSPVQSVEDGKINVPVLALTYEEAVSQLGYSDDWAKYSLCEVMYSHFKLYNMGPVVFLNVLDPAVATMKEAVTAADIDVVSKQIKLSIDAIASTVVVKAQGGAGDPLVLDTDYSLFYSGEYLIIEALADGAAASAAKLNVAYSKIKIAGVTDTEIIGGYDTGTHLTTGLECINQVMAMFRIIPDLILAPGYSHLATVAAAMAAKAGGILGLFRAKALIDVYTAASGGADHYSEVLTWKATNNINDKNQIVCWPLVKLGSKVFHMSTQLAGLIATVDAGNKCPYESPSNKTLRADSIVTAAGDEVILDINAANQLNAGGVVTALNFLTGFVAWGNYNSCYPSNTDAKDYFIPVSRMFSWVSSAVILSHWSKTDKPMTLRLMESVTDSINLWLAGLVGEEKLLGGRVEFKDTENSLTNLLAGKAKWHIYLAAPVPAQELEFVLEYDVSYLTSALSA